MHTAHESQAFGGARMLLPGALMVVLLAGSGCQTATGTGAAAGGAIGAGVGGLLSHCPGGAVLGGLIGAGAGALGGSIVDDNRERKAEQAAVAAAAAATPPPLSLQQVVQLTQNGTSDGIIIDQIRASGAIYRLRAEDILYLQNNGVREPVIHEMQLTTYRGPRRVVYSAAPPPVYVVEPAPPVVGVGFGYGYYGRRW
jgi:hypothetical protein